MTATDRQETLSPFQKLADRVSYAMGTPTNIIIWLVAVGTWIALVRTSRATAFCPAGSRRTASIFRSTP